MGENCCKQTNETESEFLTTITNIESQRNYKKEKDYTKLKGKYLFNAKIICKFINYNILKQFAKYKFDIFKRKLDKHFCFKSNERVLIISPDEKSYISFIDKKGGYLSAEEKKDLHSLKEK